MISDKYIFENCNGNTYAILMRKTDRALLKCLKSGQIVIAWGLDKARKNWSGGSYWEDNLEGALEAFNKEC